MTRRPRTLLRRSSVAVLGLTAMLGSAGAGERERRLTDFVRQDCGSCHGLTLRGGLGRSLLPKDLGDIQADGLAAVILDGIPGTPMPAWRGLLTEEEARWIAARLKEGFPP